MIYIESKKKSEKTLQKKYPNAVFADVTSKATTGLVKLSPFYPHGGIPVPFSEGITASCVEAIWQGLKVFENADIDTSLFQNDTMKDIKRTVRKFGKPLGHRKGVFGSELLSYIDARLLIYLPTYKWVLENKVQEIVTRLRDASVDKDIVLLDYETNCNINNTKKPLSHAGLVKAFIENKYPDQSSLKDVETLTTSDYVTPKKQKTKKSQKKSTKKLKPEISIKKSSQIELF